VIVVPPLWNVLGQPSVVSAREDVTWSAMPMNARKTGIFMERLLAQIPELREKSPVQFAADPAKNSECLLSGFQG
jgi:hypothetical protein